MTDIVERLRDRAASDTNCLCGNSVCEEAADEIERLRAALKANSPRLVLLDALEAEWMGDRK